MKLKKGLSSILFLLLVFPGLCICQSIGPTTGDIQGFVKDSDNNPLPGSTITATNSDTNQTRITTSDENGSYKVALLPPGQYEVTSELSGFAKVKRQGVTVSIGSTARVDFDLSVAAAPETIEVKGDAVMIEPGKTQNSRIIDERKIDNLPINQRNFLAFTLTTPGVNTDRSPQLGAAANSGLSFNGQNGRYNNIMVDGLDNNDNAVGSVRSTFSQDAIEEFQVLTNNAPAEYGRAIGGLVNIITKSGTNEWHGSGFFFDRDDSLDSNNPLAPPNVDIPFSQLQYGFNFGGPLKPNKTFLFASFERLDIDDSNIIRISETAASVIRAAGFPIELGVQKFENWNNTFLLKFDHQLNSDHTLSMRYNFANSRNENQEPWGGLNAKSRGGFLELNDQNFSSGLQSVLKQSLLNELRFQYSRRDHDLQSFDSNNGPNVMILGVANLGRELNLPQPRLENQFQVTEGLTWLTGNHGLKFGGDINHIKFESSLPNIFGGLHVFAALPANALFPGSPALSSLDAFAAGISVGFLQGFGNSSDELSNTLFSMYAQDDWTLTNNITLNFGVRYDKELLPDPVPADNNNFSPRMGIAYTTDDADTNFRVGYGRFYGSTSVGPLLAIRLSTFDQFRIINLPPSAASQVWRLPDHKFSSDPGIPFPPSEFQISNDFESPLSDQFTTGVDHAFTDNLAVSASFQYLRGKHILMVRNLNPIVDPRTRGRLDPAFSDILEWQSEGDSWYRGLTIYARQRVTNGSEFALSYTLSKAEDDFIDWFGRFQPQDKLNPEADKGLSFNDERHRVVFSGIYDLSGYTENVILDNFLVSSIITYGSGRPFNILAGFDRNGDGDANSDRPPGVERNAGEGPDFFSVDLRVAKHIYFGNEQNLELLFEVFNLFNRENIADVNPVFGPGPNPLPTFGQPLIAFAPRQIQLGLRFNF